MLLDLGGTGLGELSGPVLVTPSRVARWDLVNPAGSFLFLLLQGGKSCPEQIADGLGLVGGLAQVFVNVWVLVAVDLGPCYDHIFFFPSGLAGVISCHCAPPFGVGVGFLVAS